MGKKNSKKNENPCPKFIDFYCKVMIYNDFMLVLISCQL